MKRNDFRIHPTVSLFLGCSFALLLGCTKPATDIGLGLQPASELLDVAVTDTVTVELATVLVDSLETDRLSTGLVGSVYVPRFGQVNASLATQLRLSATDLNFGANPVADSLFLQLRYTGDFYGRLSPSTYSVQPLADSLVFDSNYYSTWDGPTTGEEWVDPMAGAISLNPVDDLILEEDTLPPTLRIPLRNDLAQTLVELDSTTFDENASWFEEVPGVLIRSTDTRHGVVAFDINSGLSVMRLHYHNDNDTSFYDFLISPLSARINLFDHLFEGDLADLELNDELDALPGTDRAYVMSAAGSKVRLRFPHLQAFQDSLNDLPTVLKAELILPVEDGFFDKPIPAQDQLFVLVEGPEGNLQQTPDDDDAAIPVGGFYDAGQKAFVFNLSSTVQALMKGQLESRELYLVSNRGGVSVSSVVLKGTNGDDPARLTLTLGR